MTGKSFQLVAAGVGGQGILFISRVLEQAALAAGWPVIGAETHGMSQRGGSVTTHFKLGPHRSPLVGAGRADFLLGLEPDEAQRTAGLLRRTGVLLINGADGLLDASPVVDCLRRRGTQVLYLDADRIAAELAAPHLSNTALLGRAAAHPRFPFDLAALREAVRARSPRSFLEQNLVALDLGHGQETHVK